VREIVFSRHGREDAGERSRKKMGPAPGESWAHGGLAWSRTGRGWPVKAVGFWRAGVVVGLRWGRGCRQEFHRRGRRGIAMISGRRGAGGISGHLTAVGTSSLTRSASEGMLGFLTPSLALRVSEGWDCTIFRGTARNVQPPREGIASGWPSNGGCGEGRSTQKNNG